MTYEEFATEARAVPENVRPGQHAYNVLNRVRPDIAKEITNSLVDPFHNDARLPQFMWFVRELWSG